MHKYRTCNCESDPNFCKTQELEYDVSCQINCFKSKASSLNMHQIDNYLKRRKVTIIHFSSQIMKNLHHKDQRHENFEQVVEAFRRNPAFSTAKIDGDSYPSLLDSKKYGYKINHLPAVVIFKNGKGIHHFNGYPIPVNAKTVITHANVIKRMPVFCKWNKWEPTFLDAVTRQSGVCTAACKKYGTLVKTRSCDCPYADWGEGVMRGPVNCTVGGVLRDTDHMIKHRCKGSCPKDSKLRLMYYQQNKDLKVSRAGKNSKIWFVQQNSKTPLTIYTGKLKNGHKYSIELDTKGDFDRKVLLGISKSVNSRNNFIESDNFLLPEFPSYGYSSFRGEFYGPLKDCAEKLTAQEEFECSLSMKNGASPSGLRFGPKPEVSCAFRHCGGYKVASRKVEMVLDMLDETKHEMSFVIDGGSKLLATSGNFNDFYVHIGFSGTPANVTFALNDF